MMVSLGLVEEVERMRRVPGIVFMDSATGRRAHVAGALDVYMIIKLYREVDENWHRLKAGLHWLTDEQLRTAFRYAELYPEDVYPLVEAEEALTPEALYEKYPYMNPNR